MRVEPLGIRNEPGIRGDDSRSLCRGEEDENVGEDEGVCSRGEAAGEADPDPNSREPFAAGTLSTRSSATMGLGGRSTTDGLLLGMVDNQGLLRESSGGRIPSTTGASADRRSSALRTSFSPSSSDAVGTSSTLWSASSRTTRERKVVGGLSLTMDHRMVDPLSGRCGGNGRLSTLALRRLRAERVKFSVQSSPWTAALSVAEKQSGQHGRRGTVTRGVCGRGGRRVG